MPIAGRGIKCTRFALKKKKKHSCLVLCNIVIRAKKYFGLEIDAE